MRRGVTGRAEKPFGEIDSYPCHGQVAKTGSRMNGNNIRRAGRRRGQASAPPVTRRVGRRVGVQKCFNVTYVLTYVLHVLGWPTSSGGETDSEGTHVIVLPRLPPRQRIFAPSVSWRRLMTTAHALPNSSSIIIHAGPPTS